MPKESDRITSPVAARCEKCEHLKRALAEALKNYLEAFERRRLAPQTTAFPEELVRASEEQLSAHAELLIHQRSHGAQEE